MFKTTQSAKDLSLSMVEDSEVGSVGDGGDCADETIEKLPLVSKNSNEATGYLTPKLRLMFTQLRRMFTKALILWYFDTKYYIRI